MKHRRNITAESRLFNDPRRCGDEIRATALQILVDTVEATGGVVQVTDAREAAEKGVALFAPVADPEWIDLGEAYLLAAVGIGSMPKMSKTSEPVPLGSAHFELGAMPSMQKVDWSQYTYNAVLEALRTAPVLVGPWTGSDESRRNKKNEVIGDPDWRRNRVPGASHTYAMVFPSDNPDQWFWEVYLLPLGLVENGVASTRQEAQRLADAALTKHGVLIPPEWAEPEAK